MTPVKKVLVDMADRLYQLSPDLVSFLPHQPHSKRLRKISSLDLATFNWPISIDGDELLSPTDIQPADAYDMTELREALSNWYYTYHGVKLDPRKEILLGPGISGLLWLMSLAFVDNGDIVFVPDLCLPTYRRIAIACGGQPVSYSISARNHWLPDFERINTRLGRVARLLFLNSPHNPTGAELTERELSDLIWIASRENLAIVNDAAYSTISGRKPVSLMAVQGGKRVGVEVGSFSYTFGLPALPFGYVVGNREIIRGLRQSRKLLPLHIPRYFIKLSISAIRKFPTENLLKLRSDLTASTAEAISLLRLLGLENAGFNAVPYVWGRIERRRQSMTAATYLFRRHRIQVIPGVAFGDSGEGFLRFSATASVDDYHSAQNRVRSKQRHFKRGRKK